MAMDAPDNLKESMGGDLVVIRVKEPPLKRYKLCLLVTAVKQHDGRLWR